MSHSITAHVTFQKNFVSDFAKYYLKVTIFIQVNGNFSYPVRMINRSCETLKVKENAKLSTISVEFYYSHFLNE